MPSRKPVLALRLPEDLADEIRASAAADGRSVGNFLERILEALWRDGQVNLSPDIREPGRPSGYEGLAAAVAAKVKAGPRPSRRK